LRKDQSVMTDLPEYIASCCAKQLIEEALPPDFSIDHVAPAAKSQGPANLLVRSIAHVGNPEDLCALNSTGHLDVLCEPRVFRDDLDACGPERFLGRTADTDDLDRAGC